MARAKCIPEPNFQKIADPADIASTVGVSFTINHIAAVVIPALLGYILGWTRTRRCFLIGTAFAVCSLVMAQNVPFRPRPGNETAISLKPVAERFG